MRISRFDVRCCRRASDRLARSSWASDEFHGFEFLVYTLATDDGHEASMFGFAGRSAAGAGRLIADSLRPFLLGRDARDRERAWHDFRASDRWWNLLPVYAWGPVDACLWLLAAQAAGQPLYKQLGAYRDEVPVYLSSMVLERPDDYGREAAAARDAGWRGYKLHPAGRDLQADLAAHAAARDAAGAGYPLMSDPVAGLSFDQALRYGRELERLGYHWFEEPLADEDMHGLRELTRRLEIPVVGTEVLAKHPYSVAECIATRVVDRVRADVSWSGGVTGVMKTARLAEAFGVNCEVHTSIFHPLEMVNLHCIAAMRNCEFLELLGPVETFAFGLKTPLPIERGIARLPSTPGLGAELDWDEIDACTVACA